jgi:hypothetical protein
MRYARAVTRDMLSSVSRRCMHMRVLGMHRRALDQYWSAHHFPADVHVCYCIGRCMHALLERHARDLA